MIFFCLHQVIIKGVFVHVDLLPMLWQATLWLLMLCAQLVAILAVGHKQPSSWVHLVQDLALPNVAYDPPYKFISQERVSGDQQKVSLPEFKLMAWEFVESWAEVMLPASSFWLPMCCFLRCCPTGGFTQQSTALELLCCKIKHKLSGRVLVISPRIKSWAFDTCISQLHFCTSVFFLFTSVSLFQCFAHD